jgi:hypothetical protein
MPIDHYGDTEGGGQQDFDRDEYLREERRAERAIAELFVRACHTGDVEALREAAGRFNECPNAARSAMRKFAREVQVVSPDVRSAFLHIWIESKMLPLRVGDHRALCDAARVLLPSYKGPSVRLFRGAGASERRRSIYGLSWSADAAAAERFAQERRAQDGGSVLLETLAPPEATIAQIDYPPPFSQGEIDDARREYPNASTSEFHQEREYVVDRRYLNTVTLVRRYEQVNPFVTPSSVASSGG